MVPSKILQAPIYQTRPVSGNSDKQLSQNPNIAMRCCAIINYFKDNFIKIDYEFPARLSTHRQLDLTLDEKVTIVLAQFSALVLKKHL